MKQLAATVALILSVAATVSTPPSMVQAKLSATKKLSIEQLATTLADAFAAKDLGKLDNQRYLFGKVQITIKHSLSGGDTPNRSETKEFKTFRAGEAWLRSREREELPARESRPLQTCQKGKCSYNFQQGILHNHLYLNKITYSYQNNRPYIKTIYLLNGD